MPYHSPMDYAFLVTLYLIIGCLVMLALIDLIEPIELSRGQLASGMLIWPLLAAVLIALYVVRTAAGVRRG